MILFNLVKYFQHFQHQHIQLYSLINNQMHLRLINAVYLDVKEINELSDGKNHLDFEVLFLNLTRLFVIILAGKGMRQIMIKIYF